MVPKKILCGLGQLKKKRGNKASQMQQLQPLPQRQLQMRPQLQIQAQPQMQSQLQPQQQQKQPELSWQRQNSEPYLSQDKIFKQISNPEFQNFIKNSERNASGAEVKIIKDLNPEFIRMHGSLPESHHTMFLRLCILFSENRMAENAKIKQQEQMGRVTSTNIRNTMSINQDSLSSVNQYSSKSCRPSLEEPPLNKRAREEECTANVQQSTSTVSVESPNSQNYSIYHPNHKEATVSLQGISSEVEALVRSFFKMETTNNGLSLVSILLDDYRLETDFSPSNRNQLEIRIKKRNSNLIPVPQLSITLSIQSGLLLPRFDTCLLYTSPSPRDRQKSRMPSSA
eukprot:TRINITY_DN5876_c0_g1_i4.p1 TRINITY_DN5876_c0_g1~~TRINITY_DN5876_c0_g1_i4.p1  ORF type:complete len:341 (+),score=42.39 TRINITY_DN5876_c0_g1_i4:236-1258(+)